MESKEIKEMVEWAKSIQEQVESLPIDNFSNFVDDLKKDLTPDEKNQIDKEMDNLNSQELKDNLNHLSNLINEQMKNFKF